MKVSEMRIGDVHPYEGNPRNIPDAAVDAVASSIEQYGWRQPIVVDAARIVIVGHVRLLAAQKLGLTKVPVHVAKDMDPQQALEYRIADNRIGDLTDFDFDKLEEEVAQITAGIPGFTAEQLDVLRGTDVMKGVDEVESVQDLTPEDVTQAQRKIDERFEDRPRATRTLTCVRCKHEFPIQ